MKLRIILACVMIFQMAASPRFAQAHRWHIGHHSNFVGNSFFGGGSYYRGSSYYGGGSSYYPRSTCYRSYSYSPSYSSPSYSYSPYYSSSVSYAPTYGTGYGVGSNYSSYPSVTYPGVACPNVTYSNSAYSNAPYPCAGTVQQTNSYGLGYGSVGGASQIGLSNSNPLTGTNLSGSLFQPNYLSMPVAVGNGSSGFLQIPVGSQAGRASYLQIPVNIGNGPPSYLQIDLGRSPSETPPPPTPASSLTPLGSTSPIISQTVARFLDEIHNTDSHQLPPVVPTVHMAPVHMIATIGSGLTTSAKSVTTDRILPTGVSLANSGLQYLVVSKPNELTVTHNPQQAMKALNTKDTSFSLTNDDTMLVPRAEEQVESQVDEIRVAPGHEDTPWIAKQK